MILLILIVIIFSLTLNLMSQNLPNYYTTVDSLNAYYDAHPELKTGDNDYNQFRRWEEFWQDRVYGIDSSYKGSLKLYIDKISDDILGHNGSEDLTPIAAHWQQSGPTGISKQVMGLVSCIYVDTISDTSLNTIYIGTNASGIWKTTDGGAHWVNKTDGLGAPNLGILDIKGDPVDGNIIYAASGGNGLSRFLAPGYGIGIIKSADGGESWDTLRYTKPDELSQVFQLLIDPGNRNRIYALIDSLVYRSNDGGVTWNCIFDSLHYRGGYDVRNLRDIEMKPGDSNVLYVASDDFNGWQQTAFAEIWKTTNATSENPSWVRLDTLFNPIIYEYDTADSQYIAVRTTERYELSVSKKDPNALFATYKTYGLGAFGNVKIWKSFNCGSSWQLMFDGEVDDGEDYFRLELLVSPTDTGIVYVGGYAMARIEHWDTATLVVTLDNYTNYHIDTRAALIVRSSDPSQHGAYDVLFAGNDGGISKTTDGIEHWTNLNGEGLINTQFWGIGGSQGNPSFIAGGTQDNSIFICDNYGVWDHNTGGTLMGADMGDVMADPSNSDMFYIVKWNCGQTGAGILKTINGGISWDELSEIVGLGEFKPNRPVVMNPRNSSTFCVGGHHIGITHNAGNNFDILAVPQYVTDTNEKAGALYISPGDTSTIYMAYANPIYHYNTTPYDTVKFLKWRMGTWTNLTPYVRYDNDNTYLKIYGITGITTSNTCADSIWITFGGFNSIHYPARVLLSPDGGYSWENISEGLPDMPVNCIVYHPESNGGVFVGTDNCVYYRDNYLNQFVPFNNKMPKCIIMDLEINDSVELMRAATFGRGIYETDISCRYTSDTLFITKDETWTKDVTMDRSILIDSLATLTICCRVEMPTQAKIFVKQGGKLIVENGGVLTNACFFNWQGIDVWGHSSLSQTPDQNQGYVWMKSGSILENARIGISTCQSDSNGRINWNTTGGIVIADSAIFRNNYKAVQFLLYHSSTNISHFYQTVFQTNRDIIDGYTWHPSDFVSLWEVRGVRFKGCTFENTTLNPNAIPDSTKGRGIYSINAQYYVDGFCTTQATPCPSGSLAPTTFQGLHYGIKNLNYDPVDNLSVKHTTFNNNYRAMYLSASDYASITLNNFYIPNSGAFTPPGIDTCYGLYLDGCTGYQIEENNFTPLNWSSDGLSLGLIVNSSGVQMNEIYNNQFDSLKYGILAQDENRSSDGMNGLVLSCNDYHNNMFDKVIAVSDTSQPWGIALYQGDSLSQTGPVGNTFSPQHDSIQLANSDINNLGRRFKYYHHIEYSGSPRLEPDYYYNVAVRGTGWQYSKDTCCPSSSSGGGASQEDLREDLAEESSIIASQEALLNSLIDGGNTDSLTTEILLTQPPEAQELRDELLTESPYLSDTAMQSAILQESVLPNAMVRDILVANPHSATSEKVLDQLNNRYTPMPDSMMAEILAQENVISMKETLESELTTHKSNHARTLYQLIRFYQQDTSNPASKDSLIVLLQQQTNLASRYKLTFTYLTLGDTTSLNTTLNAIPSEFSMTNREEVIHGNYLDYFTILKDLIKRGTNLLTMDSLNRVALYALYEESLEPVKSYVRNALITRRELAYNEPILLPDGLKSSPKTNQYRTGSFVSKSYMKVFPNPARHYVIVEYNLQERYRKGETGLLTLTDIRGHELMRKEIQKSRDQELINTSAYPAGTYICTLTYGAVVLETKKVIIVK